jgi:hypothetical protein
MSLKSFAKLMTEGKGKDYYPLNKLISSGNTKLPRTTAIFNMGCAHNCPSLALGLCQAYNKDGKHVCYAIKSENPMRKDVEPYRRRQEKFWKSITATEFATQFLVINALKENPYTALRINEAGDFWGANCIFKIEKIATILKPYGIKVYGYTSRSDLDFSYLRNFILSGTNFQKKGVANVFKMVEDVKKDKPKGWGVCVGDCKVCDRCTVRGNKTVVKRH